MSSENDPTVWRSITGFVLIMFGWLFYRTNKANDIASAVSGKLSEFYMKREEVRTDIREARQDLRHDMTNAITPIYERLTKIETALEKLTDALIIKK